MTPENHLQILSRPRSRGFNTWPLTPSREPLLFFFSSSLLAVLLPPADHLAGVTVENLMEEIVWRNRKWCRADSDESGVQQELNTSWRHYKHSPFLKPLESACKTQRRALQPKRHSVIRGQVLHHLIFLISGFWTFWGAKVIFRLFVKRFFGIKKVLSHPGSGNGSERSCRSVALLSVHLWSWRHKNDMSALKDRSTFEKRLLHFNFMYTMPNHNISGCMALYIVR